MDEQTEKLVAQALEGDQEAIAALYSLYESEMITTVHQKLGHKLQSLMDSVDVVQSVWKDVLDDLDGFEYRGPDSFTRWLHTCLIHKIRAKGRYFSAGKRDPGRVKPIRDEETRSEGVPLPASSDPTPSKVAISNEEIELLMGMLDSFPEHQRRVLVLRMRDELNYDEIGKIIGKSAEAVKKIYGRGLKKFVSLLLEENKLSRDYR